MSFRGVKKIVINIKKYIIIGGLLNGFANIAQLANSGIAPYVIPTKIWLIRKIFFNLNVEYNISNKNLNTMIRKKVKLIKTDNVAARRNRNMAISNISFLSSGFFDNNLSGLFIWSSSVSEMLFNAEDEESASERIIIPDKSKIRFGIFKPTNNNVPIRNGPIASISRDGTIALNISLSLIFI